MSRANFLSHDPLSSLAERYAHVRALTLHLCKSLQPEDTVVQTMPDVSPTKWHLAHVTWFFERFLLVEHLPQYAVFNEQFDYLFNSYYYTAGEMHARPQRGFLSRPTLNEVVQYRRHVDESMLQLIEQHNGDSRFEFLVTLGLNHEQQHQELLLTDIKHVLSQNPLQPVMNSTLRQAPQVEATPLQFESVAGGIQQFGAATDSFVFDNETPRHDALLRDHQFGSRLVTNAEFLEFINDNAYDNPALWLSDGWATINQQGWRRPLYWDKRHEQEFTLGGLREIDWQAPVTHVSYYEADAFARWAGARLPTEFEWEYATDGKDVDGNLLDSNYWQPVPGNSKQLFGDVWEWTSSPYMAYPGFKPLDGSLGEYNGKFMCNQMTVRGGSCITSRDHVRNTYRSFFYPDARWQFLGFRLAKDGHL